MNKALLHELFHARRYLKMIADVDTDERTQRICFEFFREFPDIKEGKMDFCYALNALKEGQKVARSGWNGKGMWLLLQRPDENSKMTLPYIYIEYPGGHPAYPDGSRVPWLASQTDILAEDWEIVNG
jgi:hypothetical protein